jgi:hypothetical protein
VPGWVRASCHSEMIADGGKDANWVKRRRVGARGLGAFADAQEIARSFKASRQWASSHLTIALTRIFHPWETERVFRLVGVEVGIRTNRARNAPFPPW